MIAISFGALIALTVRSLALPPCCLDPYSLPPPNEARVWSSQCKSCCSWPAASRAKKARSSRCTALDTFYLSVRKAGANHLHAQTNSVGGALQLRRCPLCAPRRIGFAPTELEWLSCRISTLPRAPRHAPSPSSGDRCRRCKNSSAPSTSAGAYPLTSPPTTPGIS